MKRLKTIQMDANEKSVMKMEIEFRFIPCNAFPNVTKRRFPRFASNL